MAADERAEVRSELSLSAGNTKKEHGNGPGPAVCTFLTFPASSAQLKQSRYVTEDYITGSCGHDLS